ncbi:hypothetical protein [Bacteroides sp. 1001136B_160425_E2]|uniref:hypothetical protein n=1 Tax=Bacteroides sp. 1001136B_160425_E2 TaxID=2787083 RepID=UPI00189DA36E|nr:hypothetical protein [Bacteroides sp. 1001136B_160425_E2]
MKKKFVSLLLLLGLFLVISPMMISCSDKDDKEINPDIPVEPEPPLPPVPTPIRWVENEVDGGERGVGIKVTGRTTNNFVFECTPGDKVQSYRLDVYPLCRMYNYLFESGGVGANEEEIEDLIMEALYNSEGAGAYTFSRSTLGDSYPNAEFDWANSKYSQSEIVPGAEYLIITVGCNDEGGQNPADMKICYLKTPSEDVVGHPRVDIDVKPSYQAAAIQYLPNEDCKYFYQFCGDAEPIDAFINAYGKNMYIDFMRHWTQTAGDAQVPEEEMYYVVDFGYTADATRNITATTIGLDANKNKGDYVRKDFHLLEVPVDSETAECALTIDKTGASIVNMNVTLEKNCYAMFYRVFSESDYAPYENADDATMTALARALDQEGWGIKNMNFAQEGSYTTTEYQYDIAPNASYVVAYIGRNKYGELSKVKTTRFSTKSRVKDNPGASKATIDITISDPGRTSLKLNYKYNQEAAVFYHQYIMTPDLLEEGNKAELINYLLSTESNVWPANANGGVEDYTFTALDPATEYIFAYMAEDWDGVLTDVKIVKATTEAIIAGPNPTMELRAYMSELDNFTVQFSMVKDVAKIFHMIEEDNYSASGDYSYEECMKVWKERCLEYGLTTVNSTIQSYDKTKEAKRLVALCIPIGADADNNEVIGDLYTIFWDKDKGIITDPSVIFPDAPKSMKGMRGVAKFQVVKKDSRIPANLINNEQVKKNIPEAMRSESTIYLDLKRLGKHPHAK